MSTERQFLFVGGEWIKPASSKRIEVINATTEEVIGSVPEGSEMGPESVAAYQQLKSIYLMG